MGFINQTSKRNCKLASNAWGLFGWKLQTSLAKKTHHHSSYFVEKVVKVPLIHNWQLGCSYNISTEFITLSGIKGNKKGINKERQSDSLLQRIIRPIFCHLCEKLPRIFRNL